MTNRKNVSRKGNRSKQFGGMPERKAASRLFLSGRGKGYVKVTYLAHSGFAVELEQCNLLFDYYQGEWPDFEGEKPLYVFVSHKHQDHFQMKIFDLLSQYKKVHYFLGSDVKLSGKYLQRHGVSDTVLQYLTHVRKNTEVVWEQLCVKTLRSTDAGVAFLIETEGKRIYHAGDLNWWHWETETDSWNQKMGQNYQEEIDRLAGTTIDVAFVPLDPRLGEAYRLGVDYFMEKTITSHLFPMHMWDKYEWIEQYRNSVRQKGWAERIVKITQRGQSFLLRDETEEGGRL